MLVRLIIKLFPWILVVMLAFALYLSYKNDASEPLETEFSNTAILESVESIGKLELVKYNFQEVTELTKLSPEFLRFFKLGPDSRAILISRGEAVGCIDLTRVEASDVRQTADSVFISLPEPELCYYKLDLENSRLYSLETGFFIDENKFIEEVYQRAERQVRDAAMGSGILEQTKANAQIMLKPILENLTEKKVELSFRMTEPSIDWEFD